MELLLAIEKLFPSKHSILAEHDEVLQNICKEIAQTKSNTVKQVFIKVLPSKWSVDQILQKVCTGETPYMVKAARVPPEEHPKAKTGRPSLISAEPGIASRVKDFLLLNCRTFPGKRDTISVKGPDGKRRNEQKHLLSTMKELHKKFEEEENIKIGLNSFKNIRTLFLREIHRRTTSASVNIMKI